MRQSHAADVNEIRSGTNRVEHRQSGTQNIQNWIRVINKEQRSDSVSQILHLQWLQWLQMSSWCSSSNAVQMWLIRSAGQVQLTTLILLCQISLMTPYKHKQSIYKSSYIGPYACIFSCCNYFPPVDGVVEQLKPQGVLPFSNTIWNASVLQNPNLAIITHVAPLPWAFFLPGF